VNHLKITLAMVLAFWALAFVPRAVAQGPIEIQSCQTIHNPGSYKLVRNLTAPANADCLVISANFVTIDLAGFTITGRGNAPGYGIKSTPQSAGQGPQGIAVRSGSISNFSGGVNLSFTNGSIVEGIRVSCAALPTTTVGISVGQGGSAGIARGNTVTSCTDGITAAGIVTGNNVIGIGSAGEGIDSESPSTVIGNTAKNFYDGFIVFCPSNVTNNTAVHNSNQNLDLTGTGCSNTNNVAP
jgi:hypothetical protein